MTTTNPTREALLRAAIATFARHGFDGASNRTLAQAAGVNQALIAYHFGNKEGLYFASFDAIEALARSRLAPLADELDATASAIDPRTDEGRATAIDAIERLLRRQVRLLMEPDMQDVALLVFREQLTPGPAFDRLWDGIFGRLMQLLTRFVALAEGSARVRDGHRLRALSLYGQPYAFRAARASVVSLMGWSDAQGDAAAATRRHITAVERTIGQNVRAMFAGLDAG